MLISYDGCEFECEISHRSYNSSGFNLILSSVRGSVLKIPDSYNGNTIESVQTDFSYNDHGLDYFEPTSDKFKFYFVEEIHIPKSVTYMVLDRMTFPNLKRVFVDPENKHYKAFTDYAVACHSSENAPTLVTYYGDESMEEFIVPDGIEEIAYYAFSFTKLRSIVVSDSVQLTSVEPFVCSKFLDNFESVVELNGVTLAFKDSVEEFVINENTVLGQSSFRYGNPKRVVLDVEGLYELLWGICFSERVSIDCLELRNPKVKIKDRFALLRYVKSIEVNEESEYYSALDGVLFSKDKSVLIAYPDLRECKEYRVPEGVLKINHLAFNHGCICEAIYLPTTLRLLYGNSILISSSLSKIVFPDSINPSLRFEYLRWDNLKELKLPANLGALQPDSLNLYSATVDATEIQYFGYKSVRCKELYISKKMKFAAHGAFSGAIDLYTPELKIYNFIDTLFPMDDDFRRTYYAFHHVIVSRDDSSVLYLAIPVMKNNAYQEATSSVWSIDGIDLEKYVDALLKIRDLDTKSTAFIYCIERNGSNADFINLLFKGIKRISGSLIKWSIKNNRFDLAIFLCKKGFIKATLAKKLLREEQIPKEFIPMLMDVTKDSKNDCGLSL